MEMGVGFLVGVAVGAICVGWQWRNAEMERRREAAILKLPKPEDKKTRTMFSGLRKNADGTIVRPKKSNA